MMYEQDLAEKLKVDDSDPIIIVGAGWAGLSAALSLSNNGKKVIVLEAGSYPGGRARGVAFDNAILDNGQHLLLGGYQAILQQLKQLKIDENQVFKRERFNLYIHRAPSKSNDVSFKFSSWFPKALSIFMAGIFAKGLSLKERLALGYFFKALHSYSIENVQHLSLRDLLIHFKQPHSLIQCLWEPLALAALSTPPEKASASIFLNVLKKTFTLNPNYSDFLFPKVDLSSLFPDPACAQLKKQGHAIHFREPVLELVIENNHCVGVKTKNQLWRGKAVILAIPPFGSARLMADKLRLSRLASTLSSFQYHPITTIYLQFRPGQIPPLKSRLMGFTNGIAQWMFDLSAIKKNNTLSVVMTGKGEYSDWEPSKTIQQVLTEIRAYYPCLPEPMATHIITEKRAAFCCNPTIVAERPSPLTPVQGLYLAGDYIDTDFPATLEGAVQSGIMASNALLMNTYNSSPKLLLKY